MNDKLHLELFGWIVGLSVMAAWISMPLWLAS